MNNIQSIKLTKTFEAYKNSSGSLLDNLNPISGINIFVGSNNSGKSRFMRLLSSQKEYQFQSNINILEIQKQLDPIFKNIEHFSQQINQLSTRVNINEQIKGLLPLPNFLNLASDSFANQRKFFIDWNNIFISIDPNNSNEHNSRISLKNRFEGFFQEGLSILEKIPVYSSSTMPKRVYIPVLRGLRAINEESIDIYSERTKHDYFSDETKGSSPEIFSGLTLYNRLTNMLLGKNNERTLIADYQLYLSQTLFENQPITLIPSPISKVVEVKIGNEEDRPIYNLGDGIQSSIILTFLPYIMQEPTFFFIEEPEIYLHPGLQRKILNFFSEQKQHTFFLTTHSNHFLDLTIDYKNVSVFNFQKRLTDEEKRVEQTPKFYVESVDGANSSSLELLGVRNSSVFLVNATIWVEGITDRWYIQSMLNSYLESLSQKQLASYKLEEDVHYSFVEYGGSNITHWSFLDNEDHPIEIDRLCSKAIIIVDYDGNKKEERIKKLKEKMGANLIVLPGREIENLLPPQIIKQIIAMYEGKTLSSISDFDYTSYQNEPLGSFIENNILKSKFSRKGGYAEVSGTIKSKIAFCEKARPLIKYEELPDTTQRIVRKITKFIKIQNS